MDESPKAEIVHHGEPGRATARTVRSTSVRFAPGKLQFPPYAVACPYTHSANLSQ